jgi:hypothetical protein
MLLLVVLTLTAFTVLSILYQVRILQIFLRKIDKPGVLPNYSFFAPKPMTNDYRLIYKIATKDEAEWIEVPIYNRPGALRLFWNPDKYINKGLVDTCNFLVAEFHALAEKRFIRISLHYLTLLLTVSRHIGREKQQGQSVRFAIVATGGADEVAIERVMFASFEQSL